MGWTRTLEIEGCKVIADATHSPASDLRLSARAIQQMTDKELVTVLRAFVRIQPEITAIGIADYTRFNRSLVGDDDLQLILGSQYATSEQKQKARYCLAWGSLPISEKQPRQRKKVVRPGLVYLLRGGGYCKIGLSEHVEQRLEQISPKLPFPVKLIHAIKTNDMVWLESYLHSVFSSRHVNGEWFELDEEEIRWLMACVKWDKDEPRIERS